MFELPLSSFIRSGSAAINPPLDNIRLYFTPVVTCLPDATPIRWMRRTNTMLARLEYTEYRVFSVDRRHGWNRSPGDWL